MLRRGLVTIGMLCMVASATAYADELPPGKIIVAKTTGTATVLYNASPEVASIVRDKLPDSAANQRLERDALSVLSARLSLLNASSSITVRVIYDKSGDVSPVYNSPTYAGTERYANLMMSTADAKNDRDHWKEGAGSPSSPLPAWITFSIVGQLPQR